MTSDLRLRSHRRSSLAIFNNIYSVEVVDFDGECHSYEVTAENFEEAAREAESLAYSEGVQISFMDIATI